MFKKMMMLTVLACTMLFMSGCEISIPFFGGSTSLKSIQGITDAQVDSYILSLENKRIEGTLRVIPLPYEDGVVGVCDISRNMVVLHISEEKARLSLLKILEENGPCIVKYKGQPKSIDHHNMDDNIDDESLSGMLGGYLAKFLVFSITGISSDFLVVELNNVSYTLLGDSE